MLNRGPALRRALQTTSLTDARSKGVFDAIVVGAGATGSLAALLFAEAGLRVLLLDAGTPPSIWKRWSRCIVRSTGRKLLGDYAQAFLTRALDFSLSRALMARRQAIQSRCYAWGLGPDEFVDDIKCPYTLEQDHSFIWFRSRQLGGRMVVPGHGRQYLRLAPCDFEPKDGDNTLWPLQAQELDPWYAAVESRLELCGMRRSSPWQPPSEVSTVVEFDAAEETVIRSITSHWPGLGPQLGFWAPPPDWLELAAETGRLAIREGAVVRKVDVDNTGRVSGVTWIDDSTRAELSSHAPLIFLCASALESTRLLLLSRSARNPGGVGARSGVLGRNLMDHIKVAAEGTGPPLPNVPIAPNAEIGRCIYLPRLDAGARRNPDSHRAFGAQLYCRPVDATQSKFWVTSFGQMLPKMENRVSLDPDRLDAWGIPVLKVHCRYDSDDLVLAGEQARALRELAGAMGARHLRVDEIPASPGGANHECGTARMGASASSSVLDPNNQCWDAPGLFVTDGACLPSQGAQNPTLTLMALTARACSYAIGQTRE
jgi:choline dehydrogenase-like flavoprotein